MTHVSDLRSCRFTSVVAFGLVNYKFSWKYQPTKLIRRIQKCIREFDMDVIINMFNRGVFCFWSISCLKFFLLEIFKRRWLVQSMARAMTCHRFAVMRPLVSNRLVAVAYRNAQLRSTLPPSFWIESRRVGKALLLAEPRPLAQSPLLENFKQEKFQARNTSKTKNTPINEQISFRVSLIWVFHPKFKKWNNLIFPAICWLLCT